MGQIKELRARTGAGVMDCKEALAASAGDPAKAELWLLDKARSRFAKKAERPTTEGTLALALASSEALLLEVRTPHPPLFLPHYHHTHTNRVPFRTGERSRWL
jgi:translation elongation factor EF-Ts